MKELSAEYSAILEQKKKDYAMYRQARDEMRELLNVKANIDTVTERHDKGKTREVEHER